MPALSLSRFLFCFVTCFLLIRLAPHIFSSFLFVLLSLVLHFASPLSPSPPSPPCPHPITGATSSQAYKRISSLLLLTAEVATATGSARPPPLLRRLQVGAGSRLLLGSFVVCWLIAFVVC